MKEPCNKYSGPDRLRCEDFYRGLKQEMRTYRLATGADSALYGLTVLVGLVMVGGIGYTIWKRSHHVPD